MRRFDYPVRVRRWLVRRRMRRVLAMLEPSARAAYLLTAVEGFSIAEAAERLRRPANEVEHDLASALARLGQHMGQS